MEPYIVRVSDSHSRLITLRVDETTIGRPAVDVIFDVLGQPVEQLVGSGVIDQGESGDLRELQKQVFDQDAQGMFIRDGVTILSKETVVEPDLPLKNYCDPDTRNCELQIHSTSMSEQNKVDSFAETLLLHMLWLGRNLDVTVEHPQLQHLIGKFEKDGLIEIDVKTASYKLTKAGKEAHEKLIAEAQGLIKRFDIFADVDLDATGKCHFDTGLGKDYRVPIFELENIDPFKARILLGINDAEWDSLPNWTERIAHRDWYQEVFATSIENAPSIDDIGLDELREISQQGRSRLRSAPPVD
jgi:hypothetical protein